MSTYSLTGVESPPPPFPDCDKVHHWGPSGTLITHTTVGVEVRASASTSGDCSAQEPGQPAGGVPMYSGSSLSICRFECITYTYSHACFHLDYAWISSNVSFNLDYSNYRFRQADVSL